LYIWIREPNATVLTPPPRSITRTERLDFGALQETSRLLSHSLDRGFILNNLLLTAMSKALAGRAAILLRDEAGWRVAATKGTRGLQEGDVLHDSPEADEAQLREVLAGYRLGAMLPLVSGSATLGWLALGNRMDGAPHDDEVLSFLRTLLAFTAPAVENSRTVETLRQTNWKLDTKVQQLQALFDLAQQLGQSTDQAHYARVLGLTLMGQMATRTFALWVQIPGQAGFGYCTHRGLIGKMCDHVPEDFFAGLRHPARSAEHPELQPLQEAGLVEVIPVFAENTVSGILAVGERRNGQAYSTADHDLLHAMAGLGVNALRNAFLREEQAEKQRLEQEMDLARGIQQRLLPQRIPTFDGADIAAVCTPARVVGGDYLDVHDLGDGKVLLIVADATGKGMPASLLMATVHASQLALRPMNLPVEDLVAHLNRVVCQSTSSSTFVTLFAAVYDTRTGHFVYANAGHNPALLLRKSGEVEWLSDGGLLLGVMQGLPYEASAGQLEPGDLVVFYTDGVTEAPQGEDDEFGESQLLETVVSARELPAEGILDAVVDAVKAFSGADVPPADDLTLIVLKVTGKEDM